MQKIGFIGLGHMGLPMALHLVKAGHFVTGFDLQSTPLQQLHAQGGKVARSAREAAVDQDVVVTMLQTGQQVQDVAFGTHGFLSVMSQESLWIDSSTIDVNHARSGHQAAEAHGILSIDAPVSGGVAGANAATLTFMVGGAEAAYQRAMPILSLMGKKIIYAGASGNGQAAKICNNMILGISMIGVSEAFMLAQSLGLTPQKLHQVVSHASGDCWVMDQYVPVPGVLDNVPANHDYTPGFTVAMMLKDLCLSQQVAENAQLSLALASHATALYQAFHDAGNGDRDFSAIIQTYGSHPE